MALYSPSLPSGRYKLRHVIRAEFVKMATVPSTYIILGVTVVFGLLVTALVTHNANARFLDSTQTALTGLIVAGLTGGVFGAMLVTSEFSSGTIRATLSATPNRGLLLTAKIAVTAVATLFFCEVLSFISFFLGQAILSSRGSQTASLSSPGALRAVAMTGAFVALLALMSFGLGLILRSTAGAIAAFAGIVFVLPLVMQGISQRHVRYLPTFILTNSIMATSPISPGPPGAPAGPLSATVGLLLMALYAALVLGVGVVLFLKRDT